METKKIKIFSKEEFRNWLQKNHVKENKVSVVLHKKHTGKPSPTHRELIEEAICFGWIDTILRRVDENRNNRRHSKRTKNSRWSDNTLSYAKKLLEEGATPLESGEQICQSL